jgi:hypothetical protein
VHEVADDDPVGPLYGVEGVPVDVDVPCWRTRWTPACRGRSGCRGPACSRPPWPSRTRTAAGWLNLKSKLSYVAIRKRLWEANPS